MSVDGPAERPWSLGYRPAFEGLRGAAIVLVVWVHLSLFWPRDPFMGGYESVIVFFVLSGFLITSLLLEEHAGTRRISLGTFYRRRAVRLLPALYAMLIVWFVASRVIHSVADTYSTARQLTSLAAAVGYVYNWAQIFGDNRIGWGIGQTWSLSVEEQFYLFWPIVLLLMFRWIPDWIGRVMVVLAVGAVALGVLSMETSHNWTFGYYSTLTNLCPLMLGAYLAWAYHRGWVPGRWVTPLAYIALVGMAWVLWSGPPWHTRPYLWVLSGPIALASAALLLGVMDATTPLGRVFSVRPLRYLGRISYSLYLWHFLVIVAVFAVLPHLQPALQILLALAASLLLAAVSHALIEVPSIRWAHAVVPIRIRRPRRIVRTLTGGLPPLGLSEQVPTAVPPETVAAAAPGRRELVSTAPVLWKPVPTA